MKNKKQLVLQIFTLIIWLCGVYVSHWFVTGYLIGAAVMLGLAWGVKEYFAYKDRKAAKKKE